MKTLNFSTGLVVAFFTIPALFPSCTKKECEENIKEDCYCTQIYDPVCGCNGKTYGNACSAECAGIEEYSDGKCGK